MPDRRRLSNAGMVKLFQSKDGICHLCGGKIQAGEAWDRSHPIPLAMGGPDDESNWDIAHRKCHQAWTRARDVPDIAKAKRREAKHVGAHRSSNPLPGGRLSRWKKRMDGTVVMR